MVQTVLRPARTSDAEAVFNHLGRFAVSYRPVRAAFDESYPRILESDGTDLLVAEQDGRVVGYALASDALTFFANGVVAELLELYVEESERGQGFGRALVQETVARARDRGAVEVTVPIRRAGPFYLNLGFQATAELFKLPLG